MSLPREDAQAFWEAWAASRDGKDAASLAGLALCGSGGRYDLYRHRAERIAIASILPRLDSQWRVLDLGCGPGRWTVPFAQACREVVAVDFSDAMLAHARTQCERSRVAAKVSFKRQRVQDVDSVALGGPFDLMLAMGVLQYVREEELSDVCSRLVACVRSGGMLIHRETRTPQPAEKTYPTLDGVSMRASYRPFEAYRSVFEKHGMRLKARRSIIPPSLAYSLYSKRYPPGQSGPLNDLPLRSILAAHELLLDPLWRLFPGILWLINSRRPTDQAAALYVKSGG